jgi:hypothetical protein
MPIELKTLDEVNLLLEKLYRLREGWVLAVLKDDWEYSIAVETAVKLGLYQTELQIYMLKEPLVDRIIISDAAIGARLKSLIEQLEAKKRTLEEELGSRKVLNGRYC